MAVGPEQPSAAARSPAFTSKARQSEQKAGSERLDRLTAEIAELVRLDLAQLRLRWRNSLGGTVPAHLPNGCSCGRSPIASRSLNSAGWMSRRFARSVARLWALMSRSAAQFSTRSPKTKDGISLRPGALLVREWQGEQHRVMIVKDGFAWNGETYSSLSKVANAITGARWNGHRFFELRKAKSDKIGASSMPNDRKPARASRCAIYTRVSTDVGSIKISTRSRISAKRRKPTSRAKPTKGGNSFASAMMTVDFLVGPWRVRRSNGCLAISGKTDRRHRGLKVDRLTRSLADLPNWSKFRR